jgi:hypothetical protein
MKVINAVDPERVDRNKQAAAYLRELADRMERNEILDIVVVFNDKEARGFESFGDFQDRWRLLGALEYAKAGVKCPK